MVLSAPSPKEFELENCFWKFTSHYRLAKTQITSVEDKLFVMIMSPIISIIKNVFFFSLKICWFIWCHNCLCIFFIFFLLLISIFYVDPLLCNPSKVISYRNDKIHLKRLIGIVIDFFCGRIKIMLTLRYKTRHKIIKMQFLWF